jgi:hypothetical protein
MIAVIIRKGSENHQANMSEEEKAIDLSPRNKKACHGISTALMQSVAKMGTQSTMKRMLELEV